MQGIEEIPLQNLDAEKFIAEKVSEIASAVGDGLAVNALSGGVDSSSVTMLGHRALGENLVTYFIDSGLMRRGEPKKVSSILLLCHPREGGDPSLRIAASPLPLDSRLRGNDDVYAFGDGRKCRSRHKIARGGQTRDR